MPLRVFRRARAGRLVALVALVLAAVLAVSSCGAAPVVVVTVTTTPGAGPQVTAPSLSSAASSSAAASPTAPSTATSSKVAAMRVTASPAFGTKDLGPTDPISVTVFNAELEKMTMIGSDGSSVEGTISDDKHTWTKTDRLKYGVTYTVNGLAKAFDGSEQPVEGTLATVKPAATMAAYIQIPEGSTVGIAAPIVVTFAGAVKNRAAAEKNLHVTTTDKDGNPIEVVGSWGWMQDEDIQGKKVKQSRVHFRPAQYWPADTRVHVEAALYGVDYGGAWGREDVTRDFVIGPKIVVKADVTSFRLRVVQDDVIIKDYPVSYGKESIPGRNTVSGIHIVQDKNTDNPDGSFKMCNLAYGYCNVTEYWGVRINNNGEFIHVNKETEKLGLLGKANVSHGCVNMSMKNGKEFFDFAYYGIPVEVTNTGVPMTPADYVWDWSVSYDEWKTFSAL